MDYEKIKEFVEAKNSRDSRPMNAFINSMMAITESMQELDNVKLEKQSKSLVYHLFIPHLVTIIECYFRDSIDAIFRLCNHTSYLSSLNKIMKKKFSAQEIIELEAEGLHFLQIIPRELSFQNLNQITAVYDNFILDGFIKKIKEKQFRFEHIPDYVMEVTDDNLSSISTLFSKRHEIVHNPNSAILTKEKIIFGDYFDTVWNFIFCANIVIEDYIGANIKSTISDNNKNQA